MHYDSQGRPDNQTIAVGGWWRQYRLLEVTSGRDTWQERNLKLAWGRRQNKIGERLLQGQKYRGKCLPVKGCRGTSGGLVVSHHTTSWSYPGRSKCWNTQRMQVLLLRIKKIQHDQDDMHDMAKMMRCNYPIKRDRNPGQSIRVEVAFLMTKLSVS